MPLLKIETNQSVAESTRMKILKLCSSTVAEALGKSEAYVLVSLERNPDMLFGGSDESLAYLELKSLDLPEERTAELSKALCQMIEQHLSIKSQRIYIEFTNAQRHLWGWDNRVF